MQRLVATGLLLAASCWAACATGAPPRPRAEGAAIEPTLWRILRADGSEAYYLLGSVHVGRGAPPRFPAAVERAFRQADELVLEFDPTTEPSRREGERFMSRYALIAPPESLRDRVSSRVLVALDAYLEERGEPLAPYLALEPWALVEILGEEAKSRRGLDPAFGVDRYFAERAVGRMPVVALETAEDQLRTLAGLPPEVHEHRLMEALTDPDGLGQRSDALLRAWERGDDATVERLLFDDLERSPALRTFYERMIFDRNERMAGRLAQLARDGRLRFAVLGIGHLLGPRSVPALLHGRGFRIQKRQR